MKRIILTVMCLLAFEAKSQSIDYQRFKSLKSFVMPNLKDFKIQIDSSSSITIDPLDQMPVLRMKGSMATLIVESYDRMPNPLFVQEKKKKQ